ncbi:linear amide C-N hydrolase [Ancylobacter defluvii]|uniref:Choloylglycine hydrolase n=1 Tax=Ancylobacter defluvii TaxID=1282440 RepID=A0A9W6NA53_9HYPH|nr:choloylglycine hydrolase family protein [Ancylobacter defluvii]MBS7590375.1 choloylglycine hydrolase family protein [Ancylobacter defluvii]GLK83293.1 choloylglycine hydrolase [Ancylobacter defluvii]
MFAAKSKRSASASRRSAPTARLGATLALALGLAFGPPAQACTSFLLGTSDGAYVYGRTMEFGFELASDMMVIPRQFALAGTGPGGKPGIEWTAKYAAVGLNAFGLPVLTDGMNEKGLAGGILYFPDYAGYADPAKADPKTAMAPWDFLTWALTNFATVAEVKAAISGISIVDVAQPQMGITPPFHYTLHDETGASLVIEPVGGVLKVYDNPFGVMTNAPEFSWHLTNLKNYVKISPVNAPDITVNGQAISSFGQGSGLLGIPGDPTPPSRLIRALGYAMSAEKKPSGEESVRVAEHILNNFDIPVGFIKPEAGNTADMEYTQWSSVADLKNRRYYVKTYDDQVLRGVDLMSFDLDAKTLATAPLKPNLTPPPLAFPKP